MTIFHKLERKSPSLVPVFALLSLGLNASAIALLIFQGSLLVALKSKPAPTLVELSNGNSIRVGAIDHDDRSAQVVDQFVRQTMTMLYDWSGKVPDAQGKLVQDQGVNIGGRNKVTQPAWAASFALSEDFRPQFLKAIALLTPDGVFDGSKEVILQIGNLSQPQPIPNSKGKWQVDLVAKLIFFDGTNKIGTAISFNKQILVRAVDPPTYPPNPTPLQTVVLGMRQSGLEIYLIRDLAIKNNL